MSINPTYPGVYIQELPSAVRTIIGVSTSVTAFIGRALKGPIDNYHLINNFSDYARRYGGLWKDSNMSYSVYQYFLNGGKDAIIIRVANQATSTTFDGLSLEAANPGSWGNELEINSSNNPEELNEELLPQDGTLFNLRIEHNQYTNKDQPNQEKRTLESETFSNLSANKDKPAFYKKILNQQSNLVHIPDTIPEDQLPSESPGTTEFTIVQQGSDGIQLEDNNISNPQDPTKGLGLLDKVDIFNMLCIPPYNDTEDTSKAIYEKALELCGRRRAMLLVDPNSGWNDISSAINGINDTANFIARNKNAAIFFPRIEAPDLIDSTGNKFRKYAPCGFVAGVVARTDGERGIWKAPAGIEATLLGVSKLTVKLTDDENGRLNPLGINCLRNFPDIGPVIWGSRTLRGADKLADQWKYLPVRRTALYIEESLYRGTQWVVFEPNDERLWAQIRLNVGAFMHDLFRKGAFQGTDPKKAYFVKCDNETTTQYDIDRGIVNIIVGFAPLKPAEFVIIQIQQITQQEAAEV